MLGLVGLVVVLVVVRLAWGYYAAGKLQDEIDHIVASGQPLFPEDFNVPPVADEANAALLVEQAASAVQLTADQEKFLHKRPRYADMSHDDWKRIDALLQTNRKTLELVRTARSRTGVDWGLRFESPVIYDSVPRLIPHHQVARVLRVGALSAFHRNEHADTIEILLDMMSFARVCEQIHTLVGHILAGRTRVRVSETIEDILPTLSISTFASADDTARPASIRQIKNLINALIDDQATQESLVISVCLDRLLAFDAGRLVARGQVSLHTSSGRPRHVDKLYSTLLRPMLMLDLVRLLQFYNQSIRALSASNLPQALQNMPESQWKEIRDAPYPKQQSRVLCAWLIVRYGTALRNHFQWLHARRAAGLRLAMRLYELEQGRLPTQLQELVPDLIDRVPIDPLLENDTLFTIESLAEANVGDSVEAEID